MPDGGRPSLTERLAFGGRVALVTGGGSGIGSAVCEDLADRGATVVVVDRDGAAAERVAATLPRAEPIVADLGDDEQLRHVAERARRHVGPVDVLVANAGVARVERFDASDPSAWDELWRINLRAPMLLAQLVLPAMVQAGRGRMVFVSSDGARAGSSGEAVYAATKAGLFGFAKSLAREVARHGITVNVVCPGPVDTPMTRAVMGDNPNLIGKLVAAIPLRRMGEPHDVAGMVTMLCSDACDFVTGQVVSVNGGITMG